MPTSGRYRVGPEPYPAPCPVAWGLAKVYLLQLERRGAPRNGNLPGHWGPWLGGGLGSTVGKDWGLSPGAHGWWDPGMKWAGTGPCRGLSGASGWACVSGCRGHPGLRLRRCDPDWGGGWRWLSKYWASLRGTCSPLSAAHGQGLPLWPRGPSRPPRAPLTRSRGSLSRPQVSALSLCVLLGLAPGRQQARSAWH